MQFVLVYLQPFRCNSLLKCVSQPKIAKKFTKTPYFGVQGHSTSSTLTFLRSSSRVLVMISSMSVPICNHFHTRQANKGKITFLRGCPSFTPSVHGNPFTHRYEILSQNTRDSRLSYGKNPKSLSHIGSKRYRVVTDGRTDIITIANT